MIKLIGAALVIACGAETGLAKAREYRRRYSALCSVCDMLAQMRIMLEYESPTVSQMLGALKIESSNAPLFISELSENADSSDVCAAISKNHDGLDERDSAKLREFFSRLGSADKICEQQRISSAELYFENRRQAEQALTQKREKLARSLGILGGIFAAIIMM